MNAEKRWWAIGDSFTYLNDHLDETGYRLSRGYLDRTADKLNFPVDLINVGINGAQTSDWIGVNIGKADFYTILLGTNDWFHAENPTGTAEDYQNANPGTVLGNLGVILRHIRQKSETAPVFIMNPVERGDFVCVTDFWNVSHGSYAPEKGRMLEQLSSAIFQSVRGENIIPINLHDRSGFTPENAVRFKRVLRKGRMQDLVYPDYLDIHYDPARDPYPYPEESIYYTYDGLHPSDDGCDIIAGILAEEINRFFKA